jgi:hypothetical protein
MPAVHVFNESDATAGWPQSDREERLWKYLRPHDSKVASCPLGACFEVTGTVDLPPTYLVDKDDVKSNEIDRGDFYEAFYRSDVVTIRGVFANGEPLWGTAEYSNGMSYSGRFREWAPHSFGEKRAGKHVYKGVFKQGKRHGKGLLLDAKNNLLYMGSFENDKPHGQHLCIEFLWSKTNKCIQQRRATITFKNGEIIMFDEGSTLTVTAQCGLSNEEFLKFYREGEKVMEDKLTHRLLSKNKADECLWNPVGTDMYRV